jgi:hypothetical protein
MDDSPTGETGMSTATEQNTNPRLAPSIESLLAQLRRAIRAYVWVEGLALALIALGASFWVSLALDWLFEPPPPLRIALLVVAALVLAWVLFRYILRRVFVRLADRSMAVLLERRFERLQDSLLTTVELNETPGHAVEFNPEMVYHTQDEALARVHDLSLRSVFNWQPLVRRVLLAFLLVASVVAFGVTAESAFGTWVRRSLLLSEELWPRRTHLRVDGFDADGHVKLARGADFDLLVQAEADPEREVPELVEIRYLQGGARGRENMSRSGSAVPGRDPYQNYNYTFKDVLAPVEFYVRGGDDREGPYYLDVVDSPTVGQMVLHCEYPAYMNRAARDIPVAGAMQLPRGTRVTIQAQTNKDVVQVQIDDLVEDQTPITHKIDVSAAPGETARNFQYVVDSLDGDKVLRFTLLDTDGIRSRDPVRLALSALADEAPQVNVQLRGIGAAITANARLPMQGEITDDYGVAAAWFEFHVDDREVQRQPLLAGAAEQNRALEQGKFVVDEALEVESLELAPKQKFHLAVQAVDTYALADEPNHGNSQHYVLDVVTPEQLRSLLEARELTLRRRFEIIIQEMTENRDALARMDFGPPANSEKSAAAAPAADEDAEGQVIIPMADPTQGQAAAAQQPGAEPGDEPGNSPASGLAPSTHSKPSTESTQAAAERKMALRRVHAERGLQNSQRSADETRGVANAFETIREELVNNRVDTEELKTRLKDGIADPLKRISGEMFPELERRLRALQVRLADPQAGTAAQASARDQADAILVEMNLVLGKMVELETFNEVLDLLRGIIGSQEEISERTKDKQKQKLRNLLEEN